ncbi:phytanoyl-CoA dioxygenase family protein [Sphingomonas sp.]|uniref:phytanoyl-CoA dioxygenase family protein n=1 Tax=Sphingomonas sp. TaxID=28214 RepID=UPI001EC6E553|nr:phytanoyl-CoA dioxygenase family protein [Sphingomonas sp.]MBX3593722.1 phytanoyl-CoA dioxygenase family protein [Sphingomonas sp.]
MGHRIDPANGCTLPTDGAEHIAAAIAPEVDAFRALLTGLPDRRAGIRLSGRRDLEALVHPGRSAAIRRLPGFSDLTRPVRAICFDKSAAINWSLAWHQDRTICVKHRREAPGFGPWTVKAGMLHVAPPIAVLEHMLTVRFHLDDVDADNAPLLIAPGSHRCGRIPEDQIDAVVARFGIRACHAMAGDAWVYSTPILHASQAARIPHRRRVLQIDYADFDLPCGLEWSGI